MASNTFLKVIRKLLDQYVLGTWWGIYVYILIFLAIFYIIVSTLNFLKSWYQLRKVYSPRNGKRKVKINPDTLVKDCKEWGEGRHMFVLWYTIIPFVVLCSHEAIKPVLSTSMPKEFIYSFVRQWMGFTTITSEGVDWKSRRELVMQVFHYSNIKDYMSTFVSSSRILIDKWASAAKQGNIVDASTDISLLTVDVVCQAILGYNAKAQTDSKSLALPYIKAVQTLTTMTYKAMLGSGFLGMQFWFTEEGKVYKQCIEKIRTLPDSIIAQRQKLKETGVTGGDVKIIKNDIIETMLKSIDPLTGKTWDLSQIRDEVNGLVFAGHDTTSSALSWTLYLLAIHPLVQEKVIAEVDSVVEHEPSNMGDLAKLEYTTCVIKETLRLYPSVPIIARRLTKDVEVDNVTLPKGLNVLISAYAMHRNPMEWDNPDEFNPERFLVHKAGTEFAYSQFGFVPFAAGPRNCAGQNFALSEMKTILCMIFKKYRISLANTNNTNMDVTSGVIGRPNTRVLLKIKNK